MWDRSEFPKNRDRPSVHAKVETFFREVLRLAHANGWPFRKPFGWGKTLGRIRARQCTAGCGVWIKTSSSQ